MAKTNAETQKTLANDLESAGLTRSAFDIARKSYNVLFSKQRMKDLEHHRNIGAIGQSIKDHLKDTKNNPNNGQMKNIFSKYFPLMNRQDRSNAIWLFNHYPEVQAWLSEHKRNINNPARIKMELRKWLKTEKKTESEFAEFGLKKPADTKPNTPVNTESDVQEVQKKAGVKALIKHLDHIVELLEDKPKSKYQVSDLESLDSLAMRIADILSAFEEKKTKAA